VSFEEGNRRKYEEIRGRTGAGGRGGEHLAKHGQGEGEKKRKLKIEERKKK